MQSTPDNIEIEWGISASLIGKMLIANSPKGIVHLSFFETDESDSYQQLSRDWPQANLKRNDRLASSLAQKIFQAGAEPAFDLNLYGTEFQLQVWNALLNIPSGQTTTYSQLAKSIGKPKAARAVGNAVSQNRIAYLIPCHRVIREDGTMGGYRWGATYKAKILAQER
jgi:AraC family transcriptional regulator of adaptative response/methylated-DNA-[protein]-cysteine methyltransferase